MKAPFKGSRAAFAQAILDMAETNDKIMFVSPDSLKALRATEFAEKHPEQYVEVGIAEQAAVDTAAGLATCGMIPFVATYAGFITMRACEQVRTFVAYPELNVKLYGVNAGLIGGEREGVTHQFYEDLGIISNIPGITILTPADPAQAYHAVKYAAEIQGPVYIRAGSGKEPEVYDFETPFNPEGVTFLRNYGADTLVLSSGFVLDRVLAAADALHAEGIDVTVGDVNIQYMEEPKALLAAIKAAKRIVTVEDHNVNGGLAAYIRKLTAELDPKFVKAIGLTTFGESGPAKELADAYGFSPECIAASVKEFIG